MTLYILIRPHMGSRTVSAAAALLAFASAAFVYAAIRKELFSRYVRDRYAWAEKGSKKLALLLRLDSLDAPPGARLCRSSEALTADDVLEAVRESPNGAVIISAAEPTARAEALLKTLGGRVKLIPAEEYFADEMENHRVSDEEIASFIISQRRRRPRRLSAREFRASFRTRPGAYLALGAGLFAMSFITRHALYFRVVSWLCASAGALAAAGAGKRKTPGSGSPEI